MSPAVSWLLSCLVALVIANGTLFTVYQTDQALVVRLGEPLRVVTEPGLNFKLPFLDSVIDIDKRILDLENPPKRSSPPTRSGWWSMRSRATASTTR